ncbi:hypothetical protein Tco_1153712 [Tanacetum coccineum]
MESLDDKNSYPPRTRLFSSPCCARCGTPVDGPSCRGCAFLRKKFDEDLLAYCVENGIFKDFQDTSESSDDNTNVVNALREPCVVNQDPGVKSSQDPPQIDHNCCYECGDSLDGIFCQQCICKFCGKGAHYGYNCPPKVPIISNPEQCNQTINELPQILPNENSFIYNSKPHSFNVSPSVLTYPPQLQFETYLCELCGNNAHYGYDCSPQFPFVYEQEPCYNQNFNDNYFPQNSQSYSQQYLCCANCGGPHETFQCQPMNEDYCEKNSCYYPNSSGFDHPQPPQDSVDHQGILQVLNKMEEKLEEIIRDRRKKIEDMREKIDEEYERDCEIRIQKLKQDFNEWGSKVRKKEQAYEEEKYFAACRYMLSVTCDDEDDYLPLGDIIAQNSTSKEITPDLPIEEPDNSLNIGDEHLDTIPATESDKVIKSSVENLVPIPSEFEGISDDTCDVPNCDNNCVNVEFDFVESLINRDTLIVNSSKIDPILEEFADELAHIAPILPGIVESDPDDDISSDDDDFEDVEYVSFEEVNDVEQEEKDCLITNIKSLKDNPNPIPVTYSDSSDTFLSHSDNSLPEFESLSDHTEETRSGSTTTHANYSLPEFESFHFDLSFPRPPPEPPDVEICLYFEPDVSVIDNLNELNDDQKGSEIEVYQNVEDDDSFAFVIRTFLPFLTYPESRWHLIRMGLSCALMFIQTFMRARLRISFPFAPEREGLCEGYGVVEDFRTSIVFRRGERGRRRGRVEESWRDEEGSYEEGES